MERDPTMSFDIAAAVYGLGVISGLVLLIFFGSRMFPGIWPGPARRPFDWRVDAPELNEPSHVRIVWRHAEKIHWRDQ